MKKAILYIILSIFLFQYSCKNKQSQYSPLVIDLNFEYADSAFVINKVYDYPLDYTLKIEQLKLYISHVALQKVSGEVIDISEVFFVDANDPSSLKGSIPSGDYTKLIYSIGVPQELNGTQNPEFDAALFNADHPLSLNNGMYWTWATGYRFVLLDGRVNTNPDEDDDFETLLSIHTGKDYSFRSKIMSLDKRALENQEFKLNLIFDVQKFLAGEDDVIDIAVDNQSHGTNEELANRMSDNVIKATRIE